MSELNNKQINMTDCICPLKDDFTLLEKLYGATPGPDYGLSYSIFAGNNFLKHIMESMSYEKPGSANLLFYAACPGTNGGSMTAARSLPTDGYDNFKTHFTSIVPQLTTVLNDLATSSAQLCGLFVMLEDIITTAQGYLDVTTDITNFEKNVLPLFPTAYFNKDSNFTILNSFSNIVNKVNKLSNLVLLIISTYKSICDLSAKPSLPPSTNLKDQTSCLCGYSSIFSRWKQEVFTSGLSNLVIESSDALYSTPTALSLYSSFSLCPKVQVFSYYVLNLETSKIPNFVKDFNTRIETISTDVDNYIKCPSASCSPGIWQTVNQIQPLIASLKSLVANYLSSAAGKTNMDAFSYGITSTQDLATVIALMSEAVAIFYYGCPTPPTVDPGCPADIIPDIPGDDIEVTWCCKKCPKKNDS